jgi:hypothetical protein
LIIAWGSHFVLSKNSQPQLLLLLLLLLLLPHTCQMKQAAMLE